MSFQNELLTIQYQIPVRTRDEHGAPYVRYQDAGTLRCALFQTSVEFSDGEPEVCVERYTALVPRVRVLFPDCRLLDGEDVYVVEEAVSSKRWCIAHCRKETRI